MDSLTVKQFLTELGTSKVSALQWKLSGESLLFSPGLTENPRLSNQEISTKEFWKRVHSSDRMTIRSILQEHLKSGGAFELKFRLKNNARKYTWFRGSGRIFNDSKDNSKFLKAILIDISEEAALAEKLCLSEERLKQASEFAEIGLWEFAEDNPEDDTNRSLWWSDSLYSTLGYRKGEIAPSGNTFFQLTHPDDWHNISANIKTGLKKSSEPIDLELRLKHKTDGYRWFRSIGRKQQLESGKFRSMGALVDINDLKAIQREAEENTQKLHQTNQNLEHFAYAASHDLKAPLRGLKSLVNWIDEDLKKSTPGIRQNLYLMRKRITRMENLLTDILSYSRAGRRNEKPQQVDLQLLINEVWDCNGASKTFRLSVELNNPTAYLSKTLLEQSFCNLISNAIKHHDKGSGEIKIRYRVTTKNHFFSVTDDGPGIAPEFHDKIFQVFETLKPRDQIEGCGVGLAIVKKHIKSVGGDVWLESKTKSRGSTFHFTLPIERSSVLPQKHVSDY